jgi:hypothetical protein
MKYISILAILVAAMGAMSGCASDTTATTSTGAPVPGEVKSSEERVSGGVGASGPNASVKW